MENGNSVAYAIFNLEDRGKFFIGSGEEVYQGMIIGEHNRDNDLEVNPLKGKKLTNVRASGTDEAVRLTTPTKLSLEQAIAYIDDDELVEVTVAGDEHDLHVRAAVAGGQGADDVVGLVALDRDRAEAEAFDQGAEVGPLGARDDAVCGRPPPADRRGKAVFFRIQELRGEKCCSNTRATRETWFV